MFADPAEARKCPKGDVILVQDLQTGLIFNKAFRSVMLEYDAAYQNEQAVSATFRAHLHYVSNIIRRHFSGHTLVEVGCGKGYFLEHLQQSGFEITGFDPTYEGENPAILKKHFRPGLGLRTDGVVLRHVLEHVQDPVNFLAKLSEANAGAGKIYIEVPCFDWICQNCAWFDIFYEHVNYFRLGDFERMFGQVYELGHVFSGQYIYVVADLATLRKPECRDADRFKFPENFLASVDRYANRLISRRKTMRCQSAIWGGASKGVIFALFMQRAGAEIEFVIDINPAKQGRYLAATGKKVQAPDEVMRQLQSGSDIFVMNANYLPEISELTKNKFNLIPVDRSSNCS